MSDCAVGTFNNDWQKSRNLSQLDREFVCVCVKINHNKVCVINAGTQHYAIITATNFNLSTNDDKV